MASNLTIESLDFDAIRKGDKRVTGDAIEFLWQVLNNEAKERRRGVKLATDMAQWQTLTFDTNIDLNDYDFGNVSILCFNGTGAKNITGLLAPSAGLSRLVLLIVLGSATMTVKHNSASSEAVNRILTQSAADVGITTNKAMLLVYESSRWREMKWA